jgi:CHAT domain-containing protein
VGQELYSALVEPWLASTQGKKLLLVPSGELWSLPFEALPIGAGKYLAQARVVSYLASADALVHPPATHFRSVLAVGQPAGTNLPASLLEARWLAGIFPGSTLLLGSKASLANVKSLCQKSQLIHLATHSQMNSDQPSQSYIQLSDGHLLLPDIYKLKILAGSLVVLSSCESGLPSALAGPEPICLSQAFQLSGAASVVASLWKVDDAATLHLFQSFYGHLRQGKGRAESLALAKRELCGRVETASPRYWAGFVLTGTP